MSIETGSMVLLGAMEPWVSQWLTPIWIVSVGAMLGLILLLVLWGVLGLVSYLTFLRAPLESLERRMFPDKSGSSTGGSIFLRILWLPAKCLLTFTSRKTLSEVPLAVREGPLLWIFVVVVLMSCFGLIGTLVADKPIEILASLARLPYVGSESPPLFDVAPGTKDTGSGVLEFFDASAAQKFNVSIRLSELRKIELEGVDEQTNLTVSGYPEVGMITGSKLDVVGKKKTTWAKGKQTINLFPKEEIASLYVWNHADTPTTVKMTIYTAPVHPEVQSIVVTALSVMGVFVLYFLLRELAPKVSAIALATTKSEMAQPLFLIILGLGIFFLVMFLWIPYNTFGEDIKMLKDSGLTLIMVLSIVMALWASSTSIAEEVEGRTALTVLSKPIGRRQFILGKFAGILWLMTVMFVILSVVFLITVAYKPIYDARETANENPTWQVCHQEMAGTVPGLVLAFLETTVLASVSVAISTRLPMLANFIICSSIYVLGHLTPQIVKVSMQGFELVHFIAQLIATILPVLTHFNIYTAIAGGRSVPYSYLAYSLLYCALYSTVAMLLALVMFEDRDLT